MLYDSAMNCVPTKKPQEAAPKTQKIIKTNHTHTAKHEARNYRRVWNVLSENQTPKLSSASPPLNPGYNPQKRMRCVAHLHLGSKSAAQKAAQRLIEFKNFLGDMIRRQTELAA